MASAWDQAGILVEGSGGGGAATSGVVAPNSATGWVLAEDGGDSYLVAVSTTGAKALLVKQNLRFNAPVVVNTTESEYTLVLDTPVGDQSLLNSNVVGLFVASGGCDVNLPEATTLDGMMLVLLISGGPVTIDGGTTYTPFPTGAYAVTLIATAFGWVEVSNTSQVSANLTALGKMISGTATVAGGDSSVTVAVGAEYNGKPVVATKATAGGGGFVIDTAIVSGGNLTITSLTPQVAPDCAVNWFIDGRAP